LTWAATKNNNGTAAGIAQFKVKIKRVSSEQRSRNYELCVIITMPAVFLFLADSGRIHLFHPKISHTCFEFVNSTDSISSGSTIFQPILKIKPH
jgi:hypothetical protein